MVSLNFSHSCDGETDLEIPLSHLSHRALAQDPAGTLFISLAFKMKCHGFGGVRIVSSHPQQLDFMALG